MISMDYTKIGLKCGLEVHQQLDTGKLFCRCPSILKEGKPDYVFDRKLRAVASELGEFDKAALEQANRGLVYEYHAFDECCCLVECDEEPPKPADKNALETILKISLMTNARIFDELFAMRKTVVDGSNTSGFQRTMLVSENGELDLDGKKVGIQSIVLEEDSARPQEKKGDRAIYSLDRQGIPLIEIATAPELFSPEEAKLCAKKLGELLRRTCKVKRGLGTIRQDINISIKEGARIELKGVQELGMIPEFVKREVNRQSALVELMKELKTKKLKKNSVEKIVDVTAELKNTECNFIASAIKSEKKVFAVKISGFAGLLGREVQPDRRFATEISDYVKARHGVKGLLHSDELPKYGVSEKETANIAKNVGCSEKDAFMIIISNEKRAVQAFNTVNDRINMAFDGVPEETRNALENGNSTYSRPLPGAARMYPETDIRTVKLEKNTLNELKKHLPLTVAEREKMYKTKGLSGKLVEEMKLSKHACFFEELLGKGLNATTTAAFLLEGMKSLEREGVETWRVTEQELTELLEAEKKGKLGKKNLPEAVKLIVSKGLSTELAIKELFVEKAGSGELEKIISGIIKKNSEMIKARGEHAANALMGDAMRELKGKASGQEIMKLLREAVKEELKKN